uniref:Uncharacterized protein n=1 Tax=Setaria italica TaxID=4555 RepID=K4APB1_SETIT
MSSTSCFPQVGSFCYTHAFVIVAHCTLCPLRPLCGTPACMHAC